MSDIGPGSLVECVRGFSGTWHNGEAAGPGYVYPVKGKIYRVRDIEHGWDDRTGIRLDEIVNPLAPTGREPFFDTVHFRPVRDDSIEIFRVLASPVEKVDA